MIGLSDVKEVFVGVKKVAIYVKRTPARTIRGWFIASLFINAWLGWLTYELICENKKQSEETRKYFNQAMSYAKENEEELRRLRKKVEKP